MADVDHHNAASSRALFRQPKALQWFQDGRLTKIGGEERVAGRFELFLDLLYVAILANFADDFFEKRPAGLQLVKYILILAPAWTVWSNIRELMNSFYNDDLAQRVLILWLMALLIVYGNNAVLVDEDIGAMRSTVAAYMVARFSASVTHIVYSFASYQHRFQQRVYAGGSLFGLLLYIPLYLEGIPLRNKIAVAFVAIIFEEAMLIWAYGPWLKRIFKLKYSTAADIGHEIDRMAALVIIVLGEFLYKIVVGSPAAIGLNLRTLRAVWTLVIAFCINWLYTNSDGSLESVHPIRRSVPAAFTWLQGHLPLAASLLAGGRAAAGTAVYDKYDEAELWILCGGLGVGLVCLWVFATLTDSKDSASLLFLPKAIRMAPRLIVAIAIILLPRARNLTLTETMSIIMALFVFLVIWETVGSLHREACFWQPWEYRDPPESPERADDVEDGASPEPEK